MIIVYKVASVQRKKPHVGMERLIGSIGIATRYRSERRGKGYG